MTVYGIDLGRFEWRCFGIVFRLTGGGVCADGVIEIVKSVAELSVFLHHFDIIIEDTQKHINIDCFTQKNTVNLTISSD